MRRANADQTVRQKMMRWKPSNSNNEVYDDLSPEDTALASSLISSPQASSRWKRSSRSFLRGGPGYKQQAQVARISLTHPLAEGSFLVNYDASYKNLFSVDLPDFDVCSRPRRKKTNRCGDD